LKKKLGARKAESIGRNHFFPSMDEFLELERVFVEPVNIDVFLGVIIFGFVIDGFELDKNLLLVCDIKIMHQSSAIDFE
jgi:hypothetical protein